ncbi:hypothetical protein BX661DRAFT_30145, partial [Kickxella alabastrina]|uniref:uncharacterized protein n=1 Tax=Kickxella alabastrina TaxID=61397 RepID=UPI00221ED39B
FFKHLQRARSPRPPLQHLIPLFLFYQHSTAQHNTTQHNSYTLLSHFPRSLSTLATPSSNSAPTPTSTPTTQRFILYFHFNFNLNFIFSYPTSYLYLHFHSYAHLALFKIISFILFCLYFLFDMLAKRPHEDSSPGSSHKKQRLECAIYPADDNDISSIVGRKRPIEDTDNDPPYKKGKSHETPMDEEASDQPTNNNAIPQPAGEPIEAVTTMMLRWTLSIIYPTL